MKKLQKAKSDAASSLSIPPKLFLHFYSVCYMYFSVKSVKMHQIVEII